MCSAAVGHHAWVSSRHFNLSPELTLLSSTLTFPAVPPSIPMMEEMVQCCPVPSTQCRMGPERLHDLPSDWMRPRLQLPPLEPSYPRKQDPHCSPRGQAVCTCPALLMWLTLPNLASSMESEDSVCHHFLSEGSQGPIVAGMGAPLCIPLTSGVWV